jgi:subtilisin family serine protease
MHKPLLTCLVAALALSLSAPAADAAGAADPSTGNGHPYEGPQNARGQSKPPRPTVTVNPDVRPSGATLPPYADGRARPLARVVDAHGNAADFVADELVVAMPDDQFAAFVARWKAIVLETVPTAPGATPLRLVRVDASARGGAPTQSLGANLQRIDPQSRGAHSVSSTAALSLLGAAADEAAKGFSVGMDWVLHPAGIDERLVGEAPTPSSNPSFGDLPYDPNPFTWSYMTEGRAQDIGVPEAWRMLSIAGRLNGSIPAAVIDGGYEVTNPDFPTGIYGLGTPNQMTCSGGAACPWHGTGVVQTLAGSADNGWGTAGAGAGAITNIRMFENDGGALTATKAVYRAIDAGAKIINISSGGTIPAAFSWAADFYDSATLAARDRGALVFAAAGNDNIDVDAEDCVGVCWEEGWTTPCENEGVICVGALKWDSINKAGYSNYGFESCGHAPCDVDIFGPGTVFAGTDPANNASTLPSQTSGTSVASPFVAGVAGLIWAVNPSFTDDEVAGFLLSMAHDNIDHLVRRHVDATASVHAAFGNVPPGITITAPANSTSVGYGGVNAMAFRAKALDWEDGASCCTVTWSSNIDGSMGEGASLDYVFRTPGSRVVTATAEDSRGGRDYATVTVLARNQSPNVTINQPSDGRLLVRNVTYRFDAEAFDPNQLSLDCNSLVWEDPDVPGFPLYGCRPAVSFPDAGYQRLGVHSTDEQGATTTAYVSVQIGDLAAGSPPEVVIESPGDGEQISWYQPTNAIGQGTLEPGEDSPVEYLWTVTQNGVEKEIGYDYFITWTQADTAFQGKFLLTLYVRDDDGWGKDSISLESYPPPK